MPVLPGTEQHPHARAVLEPALPPTGSPSHAYLFHGPAGSGKRDVARRFAAALLADGAPDPQGVAARVERGAHPDLTWVAPSSAPESWSATSTRRWSRPPRARRSRRAGACSSSSAPTSSTTR